MNKVRPAQGNIVTEEDKIANIIGFSWQRIHLKTDNGLWTTRKYKYVKATWSWKYDHILVECVNNENKLLC